MPTGRFRAIALAVLLATIPGTASATCPIERATYGEAAGGGSARVEFLPGNDAATVTNRFSMMLDNNVVLDGIVQWSEGVARPNGKLMYKCPEGDATGPELERCTVWEGVIYAGDQNGGIDLLPAQGTLAPQTLIFPDLGYALRESSAYGANGFSAVPWDIFSMKGCQ